LKVLPWCLPARPEETTDIIIRDSLWTAIWSRELPKANQEC
jgi:hypothetical protein